MAVKHPFVSSYGSDADNTVVDGPKWNADHVVELVVNALSTNTTLTAAHEMIAATGGAGGITLTLPDATTCARRVYRFKKVDSGAGAVTVDPFSAQTIDGNATWGLYSQNQFLAIVSDGSNWLVIGDNQ